MSVETKDSAVPPPPRPNSPSTSIEKPVTTLPERVERRREARYPCHDPAEVHIFSAHAESLRAMVVDISRSGIGLEVQTHLRRGSAIEIVLPSEAVVFGTVQYCRRASDTFHAGVAIDNVFYASHDHDQNHIQERDMVLYLAKKGLKAAEIIRVRDHIERCLTCTERYHEALRMPPRLRVEF
jgi:hypothetical protein